jgi:hypothetical protein
LACTRVADTDPADWALFDGDEEAGHLQRDYLKVGVVLGRAAVLDELTSINPDIRRAVGWQYGDSILVGVVPQRRWDALDAQGNYEVGMRIGQGALRLAMGTWDTQSHEFAIPEHASSQGSAYDNALAMPNGLLLM